MTDVGIQRASRRAPDQPLPVSWLGKANMPRPVPDWATIPALSSIQQRNLVAQLAYSQSSWDYNKIGSDNQLGMYQFLAVTLEQYGLLVPGSTQAYDTEAVNYRHCWRSTLVEETDYNFSVSSCTDFLDNAIAQDYLAYKVLQDIYTALTKNTAVLGTDSAEVVAGMMAVAWYIGAGSRPTQNNPVGTGAYAWRYAGVGTADVYYVQGRYSVTVLSR